MALFSIGLFVALAGSCNALSLRYPVPLPAAADEQSPQDILHDLDAKALEMLKKHDTPKFSKLDLNVMNDVTCSLNAHFFKPEDSEKFISAERCEKAKGEVTWLASYPGSGNTWARIMIEMATEISTGAVYNDGRLTEAGLHGEGVEDPHQVIVVKNHAPAFGLQPEQGRALVLMRHPLKAVLSWMRYDLTNDHAKDGEKIEMENAYNQQLAERLESWKQHASYWLNEFKGEKKFVKFEDVLADPYKVFTEEIFPFLGMDMSSNMKDKVRCAVEASSLPSTHRTSAYEFVFTDKHRKKATEVLGEVAKQAGYSDMNV